MAAPTDAELLELVKTALGVIATNPVMEEKFPAAMRSIKKYPLTELIALRKDLESRVARAAAGSRRAAVIEFRRES